MPDPFYGTTDGFIDYFTQRNNSQMALTDVEDITAALLVASEFLDAAYLLSFGGLKTGGFAQIREWPRQAVQDIYGYAIPSDVPPRQICQATYEAAARQLQSPGIFYKDYTPTKYRSVAVSGAVSAEFITGDASEFQTQFPTIAAILSPLLTSSTANNGSSLSGGITRV